MDIHKWLNDTADRVPPDLSDDAHKPDFLQHHHEKSDRPGRNYRRKRKRASSDSSVIAPRPTTHVQARAATPSEASNRFQAADDSSGKDTTFQHLTPAEQQQPTKSYEKRPRHKTRPDRYEPKSRKHSKEHDAKKERKSGQKRRKSHRSGDGGRTTGLVQNFHLNNGPKNNRLTVS